MISDLQVLLDAQIGIVDGMLAANRKHLTEHLDHLDRNLEELREEQKTLSVILKRRGQSA